ncbi:hypothetical protein LQW54_011713 [Pestalotiopsis sp. IQ-011]
MTTVNRPSKQKKGSTKYPHIDDILNGEAINSHENAATNETNITTQAQPLAETSEVPSQEPSHSTCPHLRCKGNGDDIRHVMIHTMDCRVVPAAFAKTQH